MLNYSINVRFEVADLFIRRGDGRVVNTMKRTIFLSSGVVSQKYFIEVNSVLN